MTKGNDTYSSSTSSSVAFLFLLGLRHPRLKSTSRSTSAGEEEGDGVRRRLDEEEAVAFFFATAAFTTFFAAAASMFVLAAVSRTAALAVFGVIVVYAVTWLTANLYLSKKL